MLYFITDFGKPIVMTCVQTGEKSTIPRYGVWSDGECIETVEDLDVLKAKYGVEEVIDISTPGTRIRTL
jgi:hypothetical protein